MLDVSSSINNDLDDTVDSTHLIVSLLSEIDEYKKLKDDTNSISYRVVARKNRSCRYILFKKNSTVRDVIEIPSDNINSIRWNGKFVTRSDFLINYVKDC